MLKRWQPWSLVLLPVILGILVDATLQIVIEPVPILVFKMDLGMVAFLFGVFTSLLLVIFILGQRYAQSSHRAEIARVQAEAGESRRRFMGRLDHEIKNPLTGLQAALANLQEASNEEERQKAGANARRAVERLSRLLGDLRKLSDLDVHSIESSSVDVPGLLEEIIPAVSENTSFEGRKVNLMVSHVPWPMPPVSADRDLLGLAFYNLIQNALKFSSTEDTVEVRAREDGRWLVVEVADSGPGIADEDLANVFEELYRGKNARGVEGSGLGLALVKRIVTLHNGETGVRTRLAGKRGTVFTIRLPLNRS